MEAGAFDAAEAREKARAAARASRPSYQSQQQSPYQPQQTSDFTAGGAIPVAGVGSSAPAAAGHDRVQFVNERGKVLGSADRKRSFSENLAAGTGNAAYNTVGRRDRETREYSNIRNDRGRSLSSAGQKVNLTTDSRKRPRPGSKSIRVKKN